MIIRFKAITSGDDFDLRVNCTQAEYEALVAPAIASGHPIDGATVDSDILDRLMGYPSVVGRAKHVILLV